jgi:hypothetical protein
MRGPQRDSAGGVAEPPRRDLLARYGFILIATSYFVTDVR